VEVVAEPEDVDVERVVGTDDEVEEVDEAGEEELAEEDADELEDVLLATLEVEVGADELELGTMTGFRLLYIDNRFEPPHYSN
jgi:hypothetical protein